MPKRKTKKNSLFRVVFHDGIRTLPPVFVVARDHRHARSLAEPTVPVKLYGPNVVVLRCTKQSSVHQELKPEDYDLIAEKTGIHL